MKRNFLYISMMMCIPAGLFSMEKNTEIRKRPVIQRSVSCPDLNAYWQENANSRSLQIVNSAEAFSESDESYLPVRNIAQERHDSLGFFTCVALTSVALHLLVKCCYNYLN
jgi:hypothetical protein